MSRAALQVKPAAIGLWWPNLPLALFGVGLALRLAGFAVSYFGFSLAGVPGSVHLPDSVAIDAFAWYAAQHFRAGHWVNLTNQHLEGAWDVGFTYLVAAQYTLVGHHPEIPRLVNVMVAAAVAPTVYAAVRATELGEAVATRAAWLIALWPLTIFWTGIDLLKDPVTWLLLALAMLGFAQRSKARFAMFGGLSAAIMLVLRLWAGTGLYVLMPLAAVLRRDWKALLALSVVLGAAEVLLISAGFPPVWSPTPYQGNGKTIDTVPAPPPGSLRGAAGTLLGDRGGATATVQGGGSDVRKTVGRPGPAAAVRFAVGAPTALLGPRPALADIFHPTIDTAMYPGLLVWILLIPFTVLGFVRGLRGRDPPVIDMALLALGIWFALAFFYAGGGFRQREMAFPPTLVFTGLGLSTPFPKRWWWAYGSYLLLGVAALGLREIAAI